jgi:hypothetical protein
MVARILAWIRRAVNITDVKRQGTHERRFATLREDHLHHLANEKNQHLSSLKLARYLMTCERFCLILDAQVLEQEIQR